MREIVPNDKIGTDKCTYTNLPLLFISAFSTQINEKEQDKTIFYASNKHYQKSNAIIAQ